MEETKAQDSGILGFVYLLPSGTMRLSIKKSLTPEQRYFIVPQKYRKTSASSDFLLYAEPKKSDSSTGTHPSPVGPGKGADSPLKAGNVVPGSFPAKRQQVINADNSRKNK